MASSADLLQPRPPQRKQQGPTGPFMESSVCFNAGKALSSNTFDFRVNADWLIEIFVKKKLVTDCERPLTLFCVCREMSENPALASNFKCEIVSKHKFPEVQQLFNYQSKHFISLEKSFHASIIFFF